MTKKLEKPYNFLQLLLGQLMAIRLYYKTITPLAFVVYVHRSYTTHARGIIVKYTMCVELQCPVQSIKFVRSRQPRIISVMFRSCTTLVL